MQVQSLSQEEPLEEELANPLQYSCLENPMDTEARWAPLFMGFSCQEYWTGLLFPSSGDLPDAGIESVLFLSPALAGGFFIADSTWEA